MSAVSSKPSCFQCSNEIEKSYFCGQCHVVTYCGKPCQVTDWKLHKPICDLYARFAPKPVRKDQPVCNLLENGKNRVLSKAQFKDLTGKEYLSDFEAPVSKIRAFAEKLPQKKETIQDQLCLAKEFDGDNGYGVVAKTGIKKGTIICPYAGELTDELGFTYLSSIYSMSINSKLKVDASRKANLAAFINDGPPNCYQINGYLIAERDIQQGEYLHLNYGTHATRFGPYQISDASYREVVDFCRTYLLDKRRFSELMDSMQRDNYAFLYEAKTFEGSQGSRKSVLETGMVDYIFSNFNVFVKLHLHGILKPKDTQTMLKHPIIQLILSDKPFLSCYPTVLSGIEILQKDLKITLDAFPHFMSASSFQEVLLEIIHDKQNGQPISMQSLSEYRTLGELYDKLYLWTNGTLYGTYIGCIDEFPEDPFPLSSLTETYKQLPPLLKEKFLKQAQLYNDCFPKNSRRLEQKKVALTQFRQSIAVKNSF